MSWTNQPTGYFLSQAFNKFDTVGGTLALTGVSVQFDVQSLGGKIQVDNDGLTSGSAAYNLGVSGGLGTPLVANWNFPTWGFNVAALEASHSDSLSVAANIDDGLVTTGMVDQIMRNTLASLNRIQPHKP